MTCVGEGKLCAERKAAQRTCFAGRERRRATRRTRTRAAEELGDLHHLGTPPGQLVQLVRVDLPYRSWVGIALACVQFGALVVAETPAGEPLQKSRTTARRPALGDVVRSPVHVLEDARELESGVRE